MALHHVEPGEKIQLSAAPSPGIAKTMAMVKTDRFEAVKLVLRAGDEISRHSVPGYAILLCLQGAVTLALDEDVCLEAGDWLYLERGQPHSIEAIVDSLVLLTILFD